PWPKVNRLLMPKCQDSCTTFSALSKWPSFPEAVGRSLKSKLSLNFLMTNASATYPCFLPVEQSSTSTQGNGKTFMKKISPAMNASRYSVLSNKRWEKLGTKSQRSGEKSSKTGEAR